MTNFHQSTEIKDAEFHDLLARIIENLVLQQTQSHSSIETEVENAKQQTKEEIKFLV